MDVNAFEKEMKKIPEVAQLYDTFLALTGLDLFLVFRMYLQYGEAAVTLLIEQKIAERSRAALVETSNAAQVSIKQQIEDCKFFNNLPIEMRKQAIIAMQTNTYSS